MLIHTHPADSLLEKRRRAEVVVSKVKSGKGGRRDMRGTVEAMGNYSSGEGKRGGLSGREGEESRRNKLPSSLPTPRSVSSSEFSEACRQDRGGREGLEEGVEGVKEDERGRRMKSREQHCVTEVQNFRG